MRSPLEDVTDVVLATEYYWSREPWPQARGRATRQYGASITRSYTPKPSSEMMPGREKTPAGKSPKRVRWRDVKEGDDGLSTPPQTPQLGRLGTPELELRAKCDKFCDCCSDEQMYREERSKMDSQSRFIYTPLPLAGARRDTLSLSSFDGDDA